MMISALEFYQYSVGGALIMGQMTTIILAVRGGQKLDAHTETIQQIKDATDGMSEALVAATKGEAMAVGINRGRAESAAEIKELKHNEPLA